MFVMIITKLIKNENSTYIPLIVKRSISATEMK